MNTSWKRIQHSYKLILAQIDNPPIRLLRPYEFRKVTGYGVNSFLGRADRKTRVVTTKRNRGLSSIKKTLWHEIGHLLFPSKPHWWIDCFGVKMSGYNAYMHYAQKYGHCPKDLPSRNKLIELSKKATKRMKARVA